MEEPAQRSIPCKDWDKKRDPEPGSRTHEHPSQMLATTRLAVVGSYSL
jgi:hypothetical protein